MRGHNWPFRCLDLSSFLIPFPLYPLPSTLFSIPLLTFLVFRALSEGRGGRGGEAKKVQPWITSRGNKYNSAKHQNNFNSDTGGEHTVRSLHTKLNFINQSTNTFCEQNLLTILWGTWEIEDIIGTPNETTWWQEGEKWVLFDQCLQKCATFRHDKWIVNIWSISETATYLFGGWIDL